ncbi:unnamed protein product [Zymoseptoria tritici ST99CH_1A5]|uniref:Uncharacterized protein n=1 Tax=Zymoseptoria tritici ST99CH_1A5 TaxID=1276529 RepID=A0A1Y6LUB8_ZYMTR|nr:unnamed protein product [Zymoseptoria tritici ST99CH_1A5]
MAGEDPDFKAVVWENLVAKIQGRGFMLGEQGEDGIPNGYQDFRLGFDGDDEEKFMVRSSEQLGVMLSICDKKKVAPALTIHIGRLKKTHRRR